METWKVTIPGLLPGLNEYIDAERAVKGKYKAAAMKKQAENVIGFMVKTQLRGVRFDRPVIIHYDRMEKIDTASTAAAWSTGAKGIANNLSQITGKLDSLTSSWDVSRSTGTINGGDLDSVGSVGKIDSDVNIADEDLKFLRDVAEMRYVQNFVTLAPTVAMDAQISERVDLDDVVSAIERKLEGEFIAAAEGVYN